MKPAIVVSVVTLVFVAHPAVTHAQSAISHREIDSLCAAIEDLRTSFGPRYPKADDYLLQLDAVVQSASRGAATSGERFSRLRQEALLANPLLENLRLLVVKRKPQPPGRGWQPPPGLEIGMPSNHECNSSLNRHGLRQRDRRALARSGPRAGSRTLYRPARWRLRGRNGSALGRRPVAVHAIRRGELEGVGDGRRRLAACARSRRMPDDVDSFDACYLPERPDHLRLDGLVPVRPLLARPEAGQQPLPDERRRLGRAAAVLRPGPRSPSDGAAQRPGALLTAGITRASTTSSCAS